MTDFPTFRPGTTADVAPYLGLVRAFVAGDVDAPAFERSYLDLHRTQDSYFPGGLDAVMEALFRAVEDYVHEDRLRDPGELDAEQLRTRVAEIEPELTSRFDAAQLREADER